MIPSTRSFLIGLALAIAVSSANGQSYGPESQRLTIGAAEFKPMFSFAPYFGQDGYVSLSAPGESPTAPSSYSLSAQVSLPEGAVMDELCAWVNDVSVDYEVRAGLLAYRLTPAGRTSDLKGLARIESSGAVGYRRYCTEIGDVFSANVAFEEGDFLERAAYFVEVQLPSSSQFGSFGGVQISWRRTVSPPPVTPSFGDVGTSHPFYPFIEALVGSGVTAGCGNGNFCPNKPLTRGQMAVFLAKALGLHWHD